jgi:hypothetical protein
MSFPKRDRSAPQNADLRSVDRTPASDAPVQNVISFTQDDTYWHRRMCLFLAEKPGATLFSIVQNLWPDFLALPASRRAQTWFWTKEQLERLRAAHVLQSREEADGVTAWSLAPARKE